MRVKLTSNVTTPCVNRCWKIYCLVTFCDAEMAVAMLNSFPASGHQPCPWTADLVENMYPVMPHAHKFSSYSVHKGVLRLSNAAIRPCVCLTVCLMPSSETVHFRAMVTIKHDRKSHAESRTHWLAWPYSHRQWPKRAWGLSYRIRVGYIPCSFLVLPASSKLHREAEKMNQFFIVCMSFNTWLDRNWWFFSHTLRNVQATIPCI